MDICLPDYRGGGIVNLTQSIATACGGPVRYPESTRLPGARLAEARHIVLLVIDGLGRRQLERGDAPHLRHHLVDTLTSVFPSTTASAITTFMTGLAPAQHGLTGWHMHLREIDRILAILPLTPRGAPEMEAPAQLPPLLFKHDSLFRQLGRESWALSPRGIADSPFNAWHARGAHSIAYATLPEMFQRLAVLLKAEGPPRYVYAYTPDLDSVSHRYGCDSPQARQTLAVLDASFGALLRDAADSDSWLIATADHGFIDSPPERTICLDDHPDLAALLARPLCGEQRVAYCYVDESRRAAFENYVRARLAHCADLHRSDELVAAGWFGPLPAHPALASRVGDYTLVMKDNWTIKDWLPGEKRYPMIGVHAGVSADEMLVPLIAARLPGRPR